MKQGQSCLDFEWHSDFEWLNKMADSLDCCTCLDFEWSDLV